MLSPFLLQPQSPFGPLIEGRNEVKGRIALTPFDVFLFHVLLSPLINCYSKCYLMYQKPTRSHCWRTENMEHLIWCIWLAVLPLPANQVLCHTRGQPGCNVLLVLGIFARTTYPVCIDSGQ